MFSVEYFNRTVIISAYNIRRIDFRYQNKLRKLIIQAMKQSCEKVILNLAGVRIIENTALEMLKFASGMSGNLGVKFSIMNLDDELVQRIHDNAIEISDCIASSPEKEEFAEMMD